MTPEQVDELNFRDLWVMLGAAAEREQERRKDEWRRALWMVQAIENTVSKKPRSLDYRYDRMFGREYTGDVPTLEDYRKQRDEALKRVQQRNDSSGTRSQDQGRSV